MNVLDGKVAIVTGGNSGIGFATVQAMTRAGATVAVADIQSRIREELDSEHTFYCQTDISKAEDVKQLMEQVHKCCGKIDILVNNAGVAFLGDSDTFPDAQWYKTIDVNLSGAFLCSKYVVPYMKQNGGGSIVNLSSVMGHVGAPRQVAYNASKSGILALTRCFAVEFAANNIRVNAVCPGFVETPMVLGSGEEQLNYLKGLHPMGRLAKPEEIANSILFLASDYSSFTTGAALMVDGGYTAQ